MIVNDSMSNRFASDLKSPDGHNQRAKDVIITKPKLRPNDVLFGRGAPIINYPGNKRFRDLVQTRRLEYNAAACHKQKGQIAREIFSQILKERNGRFLRRLDDCPDTKQEGTAEGIPVEAWTLADESAILEKIKQSLRDKNPGKSTEDHGLHPPQQQLLTRSQPMMINTEEREQLAKATAHHRFDQLHCCNLNSNVNYHGNAARLKLLEELATMQRQQVVQLRQQQTLQNLLLLKYSGTSGPTTTSQMESMLTGNGNSLSVARLLEPLRLPTDVSAATGLRDHLLSELSAAHPGHGIHPPSSLLGTAPYTFQNEATGMLSMQERLKKFTPRVNPTQVAASPTWNRLSSPQLSTMLNVHPAAGYSELPYGCRESAQKPRSSKKRGNDQSGESDAVVLDNNDKSQKKIRVYQRR